MPELAMGSGFFALLYRQRKKGRLQGSMRIIDRLSSLPALLSQFQRG
jgi:hypothetical protein